MKLTVDRKWKKTAYTIGNLYIDGVKFCNTLEDTDRGLKQTDSLEEIKKKKVYGETAIPTGTYQVRMDIVSPKYNTVSFFKKLCNGMVPRIMNVPGFEGILIHTGNSPIDTYGCLLVGKNTQVGRVTQSKDTFEKLYKKMKKAHDNGEKIWIEFK